ncbi:hypothetical protein [Thiobacter aerophilum]|uniref:Uncharacterized protein n=1 Tax=Thiobacter aerophilum TaxID=3121275 RepID=A0ABV0EIM2_9BURK
MSSPLKLPLSARAWGREDFLTVLQRELEALPPEALPLNEGLSGTSHLAPEPHQVRVIRVEGTDNVVRARVGVFYAGILAGCSCADDPTPVEPQPEYCELDLLLELASGHAQLTLRGD